MQALKLYLKIYLQSKNIYNKKLYIYIYKYNICPPLLDDFSDGTEQGKNKFAHVYNKYLN